MRKLKQVERMISVDPDTKESFNKVQFNDKIYKIPTKFYSKNLKFYV
jgi:hypothetical protein